MHEHNASATKTKPNQSKTDEESATACHSKIATRSGSSAANPAYTAAARIRARRKGVTLNGVSIRELIEEGRA